MDLFSQVMKTPGLSNEIQQEIIIQKNKRNLIRQLKEIIKSSLEDIYQNEVFDFSKEPPLEEYYENKICESIEEWNENSVYCETEYSNNPCPKFHNIMLMVITDNFY